MFFAFRFEAIGEIVLNMIVHRDYLAGADSTVKIFQDRMEFFNPGTLPDDMNIDDILSGKSASNPRNKQIASIFKEAGIIEKYGSGIKRVRQAMKTVGAADPHFEIIGNFFKVTLFPTNEGVNEGVSELLLLIQKFPGERSPFYAHKLATANKNIERWLKKLKNDGKIKFQGAPKTGGYFPVDFRTKNS